MQERWCCYITLSNNPSKSLLFYYSRNALRLQSKYCFNTKYCLWRSVHYFCGYTEMLHKALTVWGLVLQIDKIQPYCTTVFGRLIACNHVEMDLFSCCIFHLASGGSLVTLQAQTSALHFHTSSSFDHAVCRSKTRDTQPESTPESNSPQNKQEGLERWELTQLWNITLFSTSEAMSIKFKRGFCFHSGSCLSSWVTHWNSRSEFNVFPSFQVFLMTFHLAVK